MLSSLYEVSTGKSTLAWNVVSVRRNIWRYSLEKLEQIFRNPAEGDVAPFLAFLAVPRLRETQPQVLRLQTFRKRSSQCLVVKSQALFHSFYSSRTTASLSQEKLQASGGSAFVFSR